MEKNTIIVKNYKISENSLFFKMIMRYLKHIKFDISKINMKLIPLESNKKYIEKEIIYGNHKILPMLVNDYHVSYDSPTNYIYTFFKCLTNIEYYKKEYRDYIKLLYALIGVKTIDKIVTDILLNLSKSDREMLHKGYESFLYKKLDKFTFIENFLELIHKDINNGKVPQLFRIHDVTHIKSLSDIQLRIKIKFDWMVSNYICENFLTYVSKEEIDEMVNKYKEEKCQFKIDYYFPF